MKRVFSIWSVNPGTRALHMDEGSNTGSGVDRQARESVSYFHERFVVWDYLMSLGVLRIIILEA